MAFAAARMIKEKKEQELRQLKKLNASKVILIYQFVQLLSEKRKNK